MSQRWLMVVAVGGFWLSGPGCLNSAAERTGGSPPLPEQDVGLEVDQGPPDAGLPTPDEGGAPDMTEPPDAAADRDAAEADPGDSAVAPDGGPAPAPAVLLNEVRLHELEWVELVNPLDETVELVGWSLVATSMDRTEAVYPIPPARLRAGQRLVLSRQSSIQAGFAGPLVGGATTLALRRPDGAVADELAVPPVVWGESWGRLPDGAGDWARNEPTPTQPNRPPGNAASELFDPFRVPIFELTLPAASIAGLRADPRTDVPASFAYLSPEGELLHAAEVVVHIKGRWGSFVPLDIEGWNKSAFKVQFNETERAARFLGLKKLTLNNMIQDPSMLHEVLSYALWRGLDVPCPRTGYAWLRVNGRDFGLYLDLETYDDVLLGRFFTTTAHLYDGRYGADLFFGMDQVFGGDGQLDIEEGDETDVADLTRLIAVANDTPDDQFMAELGQVVDWPELLRMWAVEQFIGHWDGYAPTRNNFKLHSDEAGVFRMLPWGSDQTFADYRHIYDGAGLLFQRCLAVAECRLEYNRALAEVLRRLPGLELDELAVRLGEFLAPWVEQDPRKPYGTWDVAAWVQATRDFLAQRPAQVREMIGCGLEPELDQDGDGTICALDCNDFDPFTYPGAAEVCSDGIDQDCSGWADDAPECPDCVERWRGTHRYLACTYPRTWAEALTHCQAQGPSLGLALPDSPGEDPWLWRVAQEVRGGDWWIGVSDQAEEGVYRSWDGELVEAPRWGPGQPDDAGGAEDCVGLWTGVDGAWNDFPCDYGLMVLCEEVCPPGEVDQDRDGFTVCQGDCDDTRAEFHPAARERCDDGIDQDCSGAPDDGPDCDGLELRWSGRRYLVCTTPRSWEEARDHCRNYGLELAVLDNDAENRGVGELAQRLLPGASCWIGLDDRRTEGEWRLPDGRLASFTAWSPGEPNDAGGEDCAGQWPDWTWNDFQCATPLPVLCEEACPARQDRDLDRDGFSPCGGDCAEGDPLRHPAARELCDDGIDQDCSGTPDDGPACPPTAGPFAYLADPADWDTQRARCQQLGGELAWFEALDEEAVAWELVQRTVPGSEAWIGLEDREVEFLFRWVATGQQPAYTHWLEGQPNNRNGNQRCVRIMGGFWNDSECDLALPGLCRR